jgi:hypothetical protein
VLGVLGRVKEIVKSAVEAVRVGSAKGDERRRQGRKRCHRAGEGGRRG